MARPALRDLLATSEAQGVNPQRVISMLCSRGFLRGARRMGWGGGWEGHGS